MQEAVHAHRGALHHRGAGGHKEVRVYRAEVLPAAAEIQGGRRPCPHEQQARPGQARRQDQGGSESDHPAPLSGPPLRR